MNYQAFTNDSLTLMYEAIRGALEADDALKRQGSGNPISRAGDPRLEKARRCESAPKWGPS
jgi:hypothetical protein